LVGGTAGTYFSSRYGTDSVFSLAGVALTGEVLRVVLTFVGGVIGYVVALLRAAK
jgi:hypothetical protein